MGSRQFKTGYRWATLWVNISARKPFLHSDPNEIHTSVINVWSNNPMTLMVERERGGEITLCITSFRLSTLGQIVLSSVDTGRMDLASRRRNVTGG